MSSRDTKAETQAIGQILWEDWDPIGCGVPRDEYDSYVWPVYKLLIDGEGRDAVAGYLRYVADEYITCPVPEERLARVLDKIFGLGIKPTEEQT
ncbi:MAG: hypothetical protein WDM79_03985 [Terricaulis sp.]